MRLLITGAGGMLGQDVHSAGTAAGHDVVATPRAELDIADATAVQDAVSQARPDFVINCAAFTNVDGAEASPTEALAANGRGAGNVARAAEACGAWTVQISSDYVFDGTKRQPYVESDPVGPASVYGRSKLQGELEVRRAAPQRHTIVRSSWLFGTGGPSFPATILRLASERDELTVVDDQEGCPTFTAHLAQAMITLCSGEPVPGILHVVGAGSCTWYELAREIVATAGLACDVTPGTTAELGRPAPRPAYSVLGTERPAEAPTLPPWREGLAEFMAAGVASR